MLISILIGAALVIFTVVLHAVGIIWWIRQFVPRSLAEEEASPIRSMCILAMTTFFLVLLHVIPVVLWAVVYFTSSKIEGLETFEESVYFSFVTYTSLGYGDVTVHGDRRIMTGIEALNGILLAGLSTAMLVSVGQRVINIATARRA
jgi:hypothetical protein